MTIRDNHSPNCTILRMNHGDHSETVIARNRMQGEQLFMFAFRNQYGKTIVSSEACPGNLLLKIWDLCVRRWPGGELDYLKVGSPEGEPPLTDPNGLRPAA